MRPLVPVLLAVVAAGCGGESGDLLAIEVSGGPEAVERSIVVTGDGRGSCNRGELQPISNQHLIDARELERELTELDQDERRFAGGEGRSYVARVRDGAVRWSEGTEPKPEVLARLELLALQLGRELCG